MGYKQKVTRFEQIGTNAKILNDSFCLFDSTRREVLFAIHISCEKIQRIQSFGYCSVIQLAEKSLSHDYCDAAGDAPNVIISSTFR